MALVLGAPGALTHLSYILSFQSWEYFSRLASVFQRWAVQWISEDSESYVDLGGEMRAPYWEISVTMQSSRRPWTFVILFLTLQLMNLTALALEATFAGCTKLCILPLNVRTLSLDYPDSELGLSFLSSEYPNLWLLCWGFLLFSLWLSDDRVRIVLCESGLCIWPLNWLFKYLLLLIWINIF